MTKESKNIKSQMNPNAWLVIPAFNESKVIAEVINGVLTYTQNIIVVDDRSDDDTSRILFDIGVIVINHPINLGQGAALQTGIDFALMNGAEIIVTFDADGQHKIEDANKLVNVIANDEADIVCGSRFMGIPAKNIPIQKQFFLQLAALFTRITTGVSVTDAHNGLRALSRKAAERIRIKQNRMAHSSEIMLQIKEHGLRFKEVPVEIIYSEYSLSKGQKLSNSFNILMDLFLGRIHK